MRIVNEERIDISINRWVSCDNICNIHDSIVKIEKNRIVLLSHSKNCAINFKLSKIKLSALRGKMTKQSNKEIDSQIQMLRNEWNTNF
jgi:hypothetical protein